MDFDDFTIDVQSIELSKGVFQGHGVDFKAKNSNKIMASGNDQKMCSNGTNEKNSKKEKTSKKDIEDFR